MPSRSPSTKSAVFNSGRYRWHSEVIRDRKLKPSAQRVAQLMFDHMNEERGYAWPSVAYIGKELRVDRSTVIRSLRQLVERGWLSKRQSTGRGNTNEYKLAFGLIGEDAEDE